MRVAVIDCGTNTVRLYIADGEPGGPLAEVIRQTAYVRLGEGVDANRQFTEGALTRTFAAVDQFAQLIDQAGVERVRFIATSAARDVINRQALFDGVYARLGVDPDVISGEEEAALSFAGALSGGPVTGPVLVTDIGGGSTEFVLGDATGRITAKVSTDLGSVRLRERYLHSNPPTLPEFGQAVEFVEATLAAVEFDWGEVETWLGVAGTCTSLSAMAMDLTTYDRSLVHNSVLRDDQIERLTMSLMTLTVRQTMARYPTLEPLRAEVICAGALILDRAMLRVKRPLIVRETDILDGAARRLLDLPS